MIKLRITDNRRVVETYEFDVATAHIPSRDVEIYHMIRDWASSKHRNAKALVRSQSASDRKKQARIEDIRAYMSKYMSKTQLDKLVRQLQRYDVQSPAWLPFIPRKKAIAEVNKLLRGKKEDQQ